MNSEPLQAKSESFQANGPFQQEAGEAVGLLKAMANTCRLLILCHLAESGELSVGELAERLDLSQSALSQHLAKLRGEGLVATRREAQSVRYRLCDPRAERLLALLHDLFCPELGSTGQVEASD